MASTTTTTTNGSVPAVNGNAASSDHTNKPIFMATHPRACSTAFERVMMTRTDVLHCVHEPFGEPFYYSHEEHLGSRFSDAEAREASGYAGITYQDVFEAIEKEGKEAGKRVFIKDIAHYLVPPKSRESVPRIAPSLRMKRKGYGTDDGAAVVTNESNGTSNEFNGTSNEFNDAANGSRGGFNGSNGINGHSHDDISNPTVIPLSLLRTFHFTFLIRHPRYSVPSYYRCTQPPLSTLTGFHNFIAEEAGYRELRTLFDYLRATGVVTGANLFVLDADDLLEHPAAAIQQYCENVGIDFRPEMLSWPKGEGCEAFEKWKGFHEDAISSDGLKKREHRKEKSEEQEIKEWTEKWGPEAAQLIRNTVQETVADYEYLRLFRKVF